MSVLSVRNFGQVAEADIAFGDLTVLVGPQATGKSITLQLLKLAIDAGHVQEQLKRYGLDWQKDAGQFLELYFGEGMNALLREETELRWDGKELDLKALAARRRKAGDEQLFFIPAQRVLTLRDGWPRPFTDYSPGDPFAVRAFSEQLRYLVEHEFKGEALFPQSKRLKDELRKLLQRDVFAQMPLRISRYRSQKRLTLGGSSEEDGLPFMVWSAGQREFVPLLLGLYWLMPPTRVPKRGTLNWVVIEELEMGLHPKAISVVMLMVFELLSRGYRVCLSTHSPQVLECVWALRHLQQNGGTPKDLLRIFEARASLTDVATAALSKSLKVYAFEREAGRVLDISDLEPDDKGDDGWGGLTEFSSRTNDAVARVMANREPAV